jgi:hypothetical protein
MLIILIELPGVRLWPLGRFSPLLRSPGGCHAGHADLVTDRGSL